MQYKGTEQYYSKGKLTNTVKQPFCIEDIWKMLIPSFGYSRQEFYEGNSLGCWDIVLRYRLRNGSKRFYKDQEGAQQKRRKVFDRDITFHVVIGEYTDDAVEALFERFIKSLDRGIWDDGNFVPLEVKGSSWSDKEDSILKAEVSVEVEIVFEGGIYKDTGSYKIQDIESEITKNDGKESING